MIRAWVIILALAFNATAFGEIVRSHALLSTPITDQAATLQCWAVSAMARFDAEFLRSVGKSKTTSDLEPSHLMHESELLRSWKLSPKFLFYSKTLNEVVEQILSLQFEKVEAALCESCPLERVYYEQGGSWSDALVSAQRSGVMPEEVYPGFPKEDLGLFRALNLLIGKYEQASRNGEKFVWAEVMSEVESVMDAYLGHPPEHFVWKGKSFTPQRFFHTVLPHLRHARARELNDRRGAVLRIIDHQLRKGRALLIQYKIIDEDHTLQRGRIGFAVNGLKPDRDLILKNRDAAGILEHYALAIGGEWNSSGQLQRILVRDTWATTPDQGFGFHWLEADYFFLIIAAEAPMQAAP